MINAFKRFAFVTVLLGLTASALAASKKDKPKAEAKAEPPKEQKSGTGALTIAKVSKKADFDRDIVPILRQSCLACHNRTTTKAGLILESPEDMIKGGDSGKGLVPKRGSSSLILQVAAHQKDPVMPPKGNKASAPDLTPEQLGLLKAWIDQGAKGEAHREVAIDWQQLPPGLNPIFAVAVSPDGQYAVCGRANQIHIYHIPTGRLVERLDDPQLQQSGLYKKPGAAHRDMVYSLAFSPDGSLLASGSYREVKLWQRPTDPQKLSFAFDETEKALCVAVSPDGNWLATGHADGKVRLHEAQTGKLKKTLNAHKGGVRHLKFSPDGDRLATAGDDNALVLWQTDKWKLEFSLEGTGDIQSLAWLADSRRIAIGGSDKIVRVWALPGVGSLPEIKAVAPAAASTLAGLHDVTFSYYEGEWQALPDFSKMEVKASGPFTGKTLDLSATKRPDQFGLVFNGTLDVPQDGEYVIYLDSDDGSQAFINGQVVVKNDGLHATGEEKQGKVTLKRGSHPMHVEFFEQAGGEALQVSWSGPGINKSPIPLIVPPPVAQAAPVAAPPSKQEFKTALRLERELKGHEGAVTALASVVSTNQWLLSASADNSVRLWDLVKGEVIRPVQHGSAVSAVASSPDGKRYASSGTNNITRLWQTEDGKQLAEIKGDAFLRDAIGASERQLSLAVGEVDYRKKQIEADEKEIKAVEERIKKAKEGLAAADKTFGEKKKAFDDATAAKATAEKELAGIESPLKKVQAEFDAAQKSQQEAEAALKAAQEKKDKDLDQVNKLAAEVAAKSSAAADAKVILDLVAAGLKPKQQPATDKVNNAEKARAGAENEFKNAERAKAIADNELQLSNKADETAKAELESQKAALKVAEERKVAVDAGLASSKAAAAASEKPALALAFLSDGATLASGGADGVLHTWGADNGAAFANYPSSTNSITGLASGPGGLVATLGADGRVILWETQRGWKLARTLGSGAVGSALIDRVNALAFSPDGTLLATGGGEPSRDGEIKLWTVPDGVLTNQFRGVHSDTVLSLEFSPDGKFLASGAADRFMKITDATKGNVLKTFEGHTHHVYGVAWKADGRTLASAGGDKAVKTWDPLTGDKRKNIEGYGKEVTSIRFIGISDQMVTTAGDNRIRIIKEDGGEVKNLGTGDYMQACAVTPDGKIIVAGGQDSVLLVWTDLSKEPMRLKPEPPQPPVVANR